MDYSPFRTFSSELNDFSETPSNFCPPSLALPNCSAANRQLPVRGRTGGKPEGKSKQLKIIPRKAQGFELGNANPDAKNIGVSLYVLEECDGVNPCLYNFY
jgi:hypothetical protein